MEAGSIIQIIESYLYNLGGVLSYIFGYLAIFWLLFSLWALRDVVSRTRNLLAIMGTFLFVLVFNIPGLVLYLLLRPEKTVEEAQALDLYRLSQLEEGLTTCRECRSIMRKHYDFCTVCGHRLEMLCEYCGKQVNPSWSACGYCGEFLYRTSRQKYQRYWSRFQLTLKLIILWVHNRVRRLYSFLMKLIGAPRRYLAKYAAKQRSKEATGNKVGSKQQKTNPRDKSERRKKKKHSRQKRR